MKVEKAHSIDKQLSILIIVGDSIRTNPSLQSFVGATLNPPATADAASQHRRGLRGGGGGLSNASPPKCPKP